MTHSDTQLSVSMPRLVSRLNAIAHPSGAILLVLVLTTLLAGWLRFQGLGPDTNGEMPLVTAWNLFVNDEWVFDATLLLGSFLLVGLVHCGRRAAHQLWHVPEAAKELPLADRLKLENELRSHRLQVATTSIQSIGAIVLIAGIYFTWANLRATQQGQKESFESAQEGQITERFIRAVDQLGANDKDGRPATVTRVAGVYGLARVARDSDKDYRSVLKVLNAYVEINAHWKETELHKTLGLLHSGASETEDSTTEIEPEDDIEAALDFIAYQGSQELRLDLANTDLRGAALNWAHFEEADLQGAHMEGARLKNAYLRGANLQGANLQGAHLANADLFQANLADADLRHADLGTVTHVMQRQIETARGDRETMLPTGIDMPESWK
jgi:hypothetical protein